jgi:hypothetical protein
MTTHTGVSVQAAAPSPLEHACTGGGVRGQGQQSVLYTVKRSMAHRRRPGWPHTVWMNYHCARVYRPPRVHGCASMWVRGGQPPVHRQDPGRLALTRTRLEHRQVVNLVRLLQACRSSGSTVGRNRRLCRRPLTCQEQGVVRLPRFLPSSSSHMRSSRHRQPARDTRAQPLPTCSTNDAIASASSCASPRACSRVWHAPSSLASAANAN